MKAVYTMEGDFVKNPACVVRAGKSNYALNFTSKG